MNKVLVIGENCIDVFVYGFSQRQSPEGDAPVFIPKREVFNDGMAYNVSNNLSSQGVDVDIISNTEEITKTRYVDEETNKLFLRVDENDKVQRYNVENLPQNIGEYSAILISDYDKGFLTQEDIQHISQKNKLVILDTKKKLGEWCKDITFIKLNRREYKNNIEPIQLHEWLKDKLVITLDKDGVIHKEVRYPAETDQVVDICGAGDTFIASFTKKYIETNDVSQSILFANHTAGKVIKERGVTVYTE
jgi:bifunctional ADP-heptose synthase (sugar kinase/adenylyltransferase)